jgi:hypothetical protein
MESTFAVAVVVAVAPSFEGIPSTGGSFGVFIFGSLAEETFGTSRSHRILERQSLVVIYDTTSASRRHGGRSTPPNEGFLH